MDFFVDVLEKVLQKAPAVPPIFQRPVMDILGQKAALPSYPFPIAYFTSAHNDNNGRKMPQTISHRGYKAKHPENTMRAFQKAVNAGTHALETDVHLSGDNTVVLSHDPTLKRCFGVDKKIGDCEWKYLQELRTIAEPYEPLPRLQDLIEYLAQPGLERIWLLLDIKISNNAEDIMRCMSEVFRQVKPSKGTRWEDRVVLGCWAAKFVPLCEKYFSGYPVSNIGFSTSYSRQFLAVPHISFNMIQASLVMPWSRSFIKEAHDRHRQVYSWTVNDPKNMDWCIRKGIDGVITDDPEIFLNACDNFREDVKPPWPPKILAFYLYVNFFATLFGFIFFRRYGFRELDARYKVDKTK